MKCIGVDTSTIQIVSNILYTSTTYSDHQHPKGDIMPAFKVGDRVRINPATEDYEEISSFLLMSSPYDTFVIQDVRPDERYIYGVYRNFTQNIYRIDEHEVLPFKLQSKRRSYV
jgi:hypothetical protein